jgi:hypothetical protein
VCVAVCSHLVCVTVAVQPNVAARVAQAKAKGFGCLLKAISRKKSRLWVGRLALGFAAGEGEGG